MSVNTVAGEVIGDALRQLGMFVSWAIVVIAVIAAIVIGLRAFHGRRQSRLRDRAADRQASMRPSISSQTLLLGNPWTLPPQPRGRADRRNGAQEHSRRMARASR
jgi:hypothetical protein